MKFIVSWTVAVEANDHLDAMEKAIEKRTREDEFSVCDMEIGFRKFFAVRDGRLQETRTGG